VRTVRSRRLIHGLMAAGIFVAAAALYRLENSGWGGRTLTSWEYRFRDTLTAGGRFNPPDPRLVFLGIDSASVSLSDLDLNTLYSDVSHDSPEYRALHLMASGWPWSREVYAILGDRLLAAGARAVVLDLLLPKPGAGDETLLEFVRRFADRVVLGSNFVSENIGPGQQAWSLNLPVATVVPDPSPDHPSIGYVNFWPGFNGVVRTARYRATLEQLQAGVSPVATQAATAPASLAFRAATKLNPPGLQRPFEPNLFRYSGPPGAFTAIPVYQIFVPLYWQRNFGNGVAVRDKIVLIGPYGNWAHDEHATPFGQMEGAELQLNSINALFHHAFLREWPRWTGDLLIALAAISAWLITILVAKTWLRFVSFILVGAGYLFAVKLAYDYADTILLGVPPVLAFAVAGLASFIYDYAHETIEKLRIRRTLEAYVSKDVVREVLDNPQSYLRKLGGEREKVALIVTDLRGFTTMSEEMDSSQLVAQLNEYLSVMVDDIFSRRGSVDKFIGDAILAVWGHVNSDGEKRDAALAVEAALLMKESLRRLNTDWQARGLRRFDMGCGVNFGEVIFGNIGSSRKMEPTVIGDAVNVTSRLEGLTKDYGRDLLLGEAAADLVRDSFTLQFVDRVTLKGKTRPLRIYSVLGRSDVQLDTRTTAYLEAYARAQESYSAGNFSDAGAQFENCLRYSPDDPLLRLYIQRCLTLMERPPEGEWTGVYVAEHK
jgi:adenylate cyclase